MGFNFGQIGNIIGSTMDNDLIDIGRRMIITNPDGSTGETLPDDPIYEDVPCHITYNRSDNPDPNSADTQPILISITIYCNAEIDLQNGDLVTAKKMSNDGIILETYKGLIGFPESKQSRQAVILVVSKN